jgi:hypothetical protein
MANSCSERARHCARSLPLGVVALVLVGCPPPAVERHHELVGVFSEQGTPLIVEDRWTSTDPDAPWFNDATATTWRAVLWRTDASLERREEVAVIEEPLSGGGTFGLSALSWHEGVGRVATLVQGAPLLVSTDPSSPSAQTLDPGPALSAVFGADASLAVTAVDAWLSPDGATVASLWLLAFEGPGGVFDLRFDVAVFFFDGASGALLDSSPLLPLDDRIDPALQPPSPLTWRPRLLWSVGSDGVYVLNAGEAVFVEVGDAGAPRAVGAVPSRALATASLRVDHDGRVLVPAGDRDDDVVTLTTAEGWIGFDQVELVALEAIDYAIPLPE